MVISGIREKRSESGRTRSIPRRILAGRNRNRRRLSHRTAQQKFLCDVWKRASSAVHDAFRQSGFSLFHHPGRFLFGWWPKNLQAAARFEYVVVRLADGFAQKRISSTRCWAYLSGMGMIFAPVWLKYIGLQGCLPRYSGGPVPGQGERREGPCNAGHGPKKL